MKNFQNDKETIFPCYHWIALGDHFTNAASCSEFLLVYVMSNHPEAQLDES